MPKKGAVTIPLFHCVFNGSGGSITHWETSYEQGLYDVLEHLYVVCLADNTVAPRQIVGAFAIKTSRSHDEPGFQKLLVLVLAEMKGLAPHLHPGISFLPARINTTDAPLNEREFLRIAMQQYIKFSTGLPA